MVNELVITAILIYAFILPFTLYISYKVGNRPDFENLAVCGLISVVGTFIVTLIYDSVEYNTFISLIALVVMFFILTILGYYFSLLINGKMFKKDKK